MRGQTYEPVKITEHETIGEPILVYPHLQRHTYQLVARRHQVPVEVSPVPMKEALCQEYRLEIRQLKNNSDIQGPRIDRGIGGVSMMPYQALRKAGFRRM